MPQERISRIKTQLNTNTYMRYSIGCAAVWAVILALGRCRLDSQTWKSLRLGCAGWCSGWTSATIARAALPPPRKLTPQAERRLAIVSLALVAAALISVTGLLVTGKKPARS